MKTTILFFCWGILALAAAKAVKNNCKHDGCESLSYDELLKYFEDGNFTAISDKISQQLDGEMPTEEEWIDIINTLRNGKQPEYLNFRDQHLLFGLNQTGYLNFSTGRKMDFNSTIYMKMERNGRMGSYSSLNVNLKTMVPSAVEFSTAAGTYRRVYFSLAEDTVTWQGIGKALLFYSYPNGTFYKIRNQFSATKGKAERKKGKAERKKGNTMEFTTNALGIGKLKMLTSSNYSLDFAEGSPDHLYGTSETSFIQQAIDNMTLSFRGDFPREGKGNYHLLSFGNAMSNRLPSPVDIEGRFEGYASFDGSQPFSNKNLPTFFNGLF